jgi:hypothetical protein
MTRTSNSGRGMKILHLTAICILTAVSLFAQGGGKAGPKRIVFAGGKLTTTLAGTLSNGQEMEYVFSALKGQKVAIANSKTSLFDFRVFNEQFDFETEFESSPTLSFTIPDTGDYNFYVRKKMVKTPNRARFSLTLTIR